MSCWGLQVQDIETRLNKDNRKKETSIGHIPGGLEASLYIVEDDAGDDLFPVRSWSENGCMVLPGAPVVSRGAGKERKALTARTGVIPATTSRMWLAKEVLEKLYGFLLEKLRPLFAAAACRAVCLGQFDGWCRMMLIGSPRLWCNNRLSQPRTFNNIDFLVVFQVKGSFLST
ncbi:hypothetical protein GOBAR_DD31839 [Gossypium barbadense]|nr:hypothetical protein GOBAR_DD31839 [Gossypium barbadense]